MGGNFLVIVLMLISATVQLELSDNGNCVIGKCTKCSYLTGGFSCSNCQHSRRVIVPNQEGETFQHFSCSTEKIQIEDCVELDELPSGESDPTKCVKCRWGYTLTSDQSKCKVIQFPDCLQSIFITEEGKEIEQCEICYKGYLVQDGACKKVDSDIKIQNCNLYARDPIDGEIFCFLCADGYYESQNSKQCVKDAEKAKCVEGQQAQDQTTTCVQCEAKRDFWATSLQNNFSDRQICSYQQTVGTKMPENNLEISKYFWAIALIVIMFVICIVQCNVFASRKHLYAENKKGYRPQLQEVADEDLKIPNN